MLKMSKKIVLTILALFLLLAVAAPTFAAKPGFGTLYYNGETVRTVVPPAAMPKPGVDNFYVVANGDVADQFGITAVAPGDTDYHGGKWAFHSVEWNNPNDAELLTSEAAVLAAEADGKVTVTRMVEKDFKCPIRP